MPSQESLKATLSFTSSAGVIGVVGDAGVIGVDGVVCPSPCNDRLFGGVKVKVDTCRLSFIQQVDRVIM